MTSHQIVPITREQFLATQPWGKEDKFCGQYLSKCNMSELWDRTCGVFVDGELAACVTLTISKREPHVANLQLLHTFHKFRKRGLARFLMENALEHAWQMDAKYFRVSAEPESVAFYRALGYKFLGQQKKCFLSMFKIKGPKITDATWERDDVIRRAMDSKMKGGVTIVFDENEQPVRAASEPGCVVPVSEEVAAAAAKFERYVEPPRTLTIGRSCLEAFARGAITEILLRETNLLMPPDWDRETRIQFLGEVLHEMIGSPTPLVRAVTPPPPAGPVAVSIAPAAAPLVSPAPKPKKEKPPRPAPVPFLNRERVDRLEEFRRAFPVPESGPQAINIRGTSGSGKTHLVRTMLNHVTSKEGLASGCELTFVKSDIREECGYLIKRPGHRDIWVMGSYEGPTGGCDTISGQLSLDRIYDKVERTVTVDHRHVLFEGLIVCSDARRTKDLVSEKFPLHVILLNTPLEQCKKNIDARRAAKEKGPLEDHRNTEQKYNGNLESVARFASAGVDVKQLSVEDAMAFIGEKFK